MATIPDELRASAVMNRMNLQNSLFMNALRSSPALQAKILRDTSPGILSGSIELPGLGSVKKTTLLMAAGAGLLALVLLKKRR